MTREDFIKRLCEVFGEEPGAVFSKGRNNGWLEQEDALFREDAICRKNVARILHMYLLKEKGIPDLSDISKAAVLHDLYDCRVCANHVSQIYLRGIMDAGDLAVNGGFLWFDLDGTAEDTDIGEALRRSLDLVRRMEEKE